MQTLLALCAVAHAAPTSDLVTSLPGWAGALKSPMYSGYVEVEGMQVHYLFVECESKAPQDAPVLVWSNGGPGASAARVAPASWARCSRADPFGCGQRSPCCIRYAAARAIRGLRMSAGAT